MRRLDPIVVALLLLAFGSAGHGADRIHLRSGGEIEVDDWWFEDDWLVYEAAGGTISIPRSLVARVETGDLRRLPPAPAAPPGARRTTAEPRDERGRLERLERAHRALERRDYESAADEYLELMRQEPALYPARLGYAASQMALGRDGQALSAVLDGLLYDRGRSELLELLGDLRYREERVEEALREWRRAYELDPRARVSEKIARGERELQVSRSLDFATTPHFNVRYDGLLDRALASAVIDFLEQQYWVLADAYLHAPPQPITVQLLASSEFREVTEAPRGVRGLYDGKIRVPLGGLRRLNPAARQLLSHELTHAVVHSKTRGNCPRWLHEGLAQRSERRYLGAADKLRVAELLRRVEPWDWATEELSYPAALWFTTWLERRIGFDGLVQVLDLLGEGLEAEEALRRVAGEEYGSLSAAWAREVLEESRE